MQYNRLCVRENAAYANAIEQTARERYAAYANAIEQTVCERVMQPMSMQ